MTTIKNAMTIAEEYYSGKHYNHPAKMLNGKGFTVQLVTPNRCYHVITKIDEDDITMNIFPGISCSPAYRGLVCEYIDLIKQTMRSADIRLKENGTVFVHSEISLEENVRITDKTLERMESASLLVMKMFGEVIDKLAHGRLPTADEMDPETIINNNIGKTLTDILINVGTGHSGEEDDGECDDGEFDDSECGDSEFDEDECEDMGNLHGAIDDSFCQSLKEILDSLSATKADPEAGFESDAEAGSESDTKSSSTSWFDRFDLDDLEDDE